MKSIKKGLGSEEKMTYKELKKRERKALKLKNRKGLSPVISTVILVAVAITVAVAVAYWMSSIAGQYTTFEKVEIPAHYSKYVDALDIIDEVVGTGGTSTFYLDCLPVVAASEKIYEDGILTTIPYTLDDATGEINFAAAPGVGVAITANYSTPGWEEYIELRNSGSKDSTITNMFLNNIPLYDYPGMSLVIRDSEGMEEVVTDLTQLSVSVSKGSWVKIILSIPKSTEGCSPNTTIDLKIFTAAGNQYPILEVLV